MKFLLTNINLHGEVGEDYLKRIDTYEIPPEALREAILNAVIHRDYSITGSDIKIAVFDTKIEITSPGGFPKGITLEDVMSGRSEVRNKVIVRIFKEAEMIEQWGRGVQRIISLCESKGLATPKIIESGMFVKFQFFRESDERIGRKNRTKESDERIGRKEFMDDYIKKLVNWIDENKEISSKKAMEVIGLSRSRTHDVLKEMVSRNILEVVGQGKSTRYVMK